MFKNKKLLSFTLAETLITLTLIGVVAAMTIVPLTTGNKIQKKIAEARLRTFYGNMQYAVKYESARLMKPPAKWLPKTTCKSGKNSSDCLIEYWNEHFSRHLKSTIVKTVNYYGNDYVLIRFADNSGVVANLPIDNKIFFFFCVDYKNCKVENNFDGRKTFLFEYYNGQFCSSFCGLSGFPRAQLLADCKDCSGFNFDGCSPTTRHACTSLLEVDGWTFKDDYPW